jgi:acetylornithine deacetylase
MPVPAIDRPYLVETLAELIRINSVNPSLVPGAPGEGAIATYVAVALRRLGLEVTTLESHPGRPSVIGRLRGGGGGRSLMLNAHLDTVGIEGMPDPLTPIVREGRMHGRGAYDMKGSLAACLASVKALMDGTISFAGDLVVAAVADEEYASLGTAEVVRHAPVNAAIVTEPTELDLCIAHKGFVWLEVETLGRAAHGSRCFEGIDANMRMGRFLARLDGLEQTLRARPPHPLVGPPSLHAPMLRGGTELSTYAARCVLGIERRTVPGETEAGVLAEIAALIEQTSAADSSFTATLRPLLTRSAFEVSPEATIVGIVRGATEGRRGRAPRMIGKPFWMDSAILADAGVETVILGPVGGGAHTADEWVDLDTLADLAAILADVATAYCA